MGETGRTESTPIELGEHEPQVPGRAHCLHGGLHGIPILLLFDRCGARRELAPEERTDFLLERKIGCREQRIVDHRVILRILPTDPLARPIRAVRSRPAA